MLEPTLQPPATSAGADTVPAPSVAIPIPVDHFEDTHLPELDLGLTTSLKRRRIDYDQEVEEEEEED